MVGWLPVFTRPETVQILLDSWQFLQGQDRLTILGYVILENHLHLIAAAEDLPKEIGDFKSYTAQRIIDLLSEGRLADPARGAGVTQGSAQDRPDVPALAGGSHPQQIQDEAMMRQKLEYIHYNPVKRGYVDRSDPLAIFRARNYAGIKVWSRCGRSGKMRRSGDAERRRRHSHAERGNEE